MLLMVRILLLYCSPSGFLVTGYDTSLDEDYVKSALFELFSSCGEIVYVSIEREYRQPSLLRRLICGLFLQFACVNFSQITKKHSVF